MQIESTASNIASNLRTETLAALTQVTAHGKSEAAVVDQTAAGYEAYVPGQLGPAASGSSIDLAESRLTSTVQFQA